MKLKSKSISSGIVLRTFGDNFADILLTDKKWAHGSRKVCVKINWFVDGKLVYQKSLLPRNLMIRDSLEVNYHATAFRNSAGLKLQDDKGKEILITLAPDI